MAEHEIREALLGKTIVNAEMDISGSSICFHCEDGESIVLNAVGDCCSYSWIESIDAPTALLGTVKAVEEIDMPNLGTISTPKHEAGGEDSSFQYYGLKITTDNGIAVIDYRNDSSGYYGGELVVANRGRER